MSTDGTVTTPASESNTTPEKLSPSSPLRRSETWITIIATLAGIAHTLFASGADARVIAIVSFILSAGTFAIFQTDLISDKPGWKTPAFWTAMATVVGSIVLSISGADLPFLPPKVTQVASLIATGLTAAGYTLYRWTNKTTTALKMLRAAHLASLKPPTAPEASPLKAA